MILRHWDIILLTIHPFNSGNIIWNVLVKQQQQQKINFEENKINFMKFYSIIALNIRYFRLVQRIRVLLCECLSFIASFKYTYYVCGIIILHILQIHLFSWELCKPLVKGVPLTKKKKKKIISITKQHLKLKFLNLFLFFFLLLLIHKEATKMFIVIYSWWLYSMRILIVITI